MLSDADRNKAADILMEAHKTSKQAVQLSTTYPGHHHRGRLRDLDRGAQAPDRGGAEADRPQGGPHLEGDAALLA